MTRQTQLPGGGYINETGTAQRQLPGGGYLNDTGGTFQYARPASDIANAGNWKRSSDNGTTDLYTMLDETTFDDSDYIYSPDNPTTQMVEVKLGSVTDPASSVDHVIRVRLQAIGLNTTFDLNLVENTTVRDTWSEAVTVAQGAVTRLRTLTGTVADSITDYADLRVRVVARAP